MTDEPVLATRRIPRERVGTIIDAIYAFSMTLLVITIDIPSKYMHAKDVTPVHDIFISVIPDLIHYFIAFILLAILWYFEHQRFMSLRYLDRPLLCMNIASLAIVCLLPFTTNLAGDYPTDTLGAILFELNILILGSFACIQWFYIQKKCHEFVPGLSAVYITREIRWSLVFPIISIAGITIALFNVPGSVAIYLLAPFIMAVLFWRDPVKSVKKEGGQP
ncbi:MAG: TMEM175 family protein [Methanoregula sp.]|nr:TMEM175 family protein [Methanoregula sp.]